VSRDVGLFVDDFRGDRDGLWIATDNHDGFVGGIAIWGDRYAPGAARLRWFLVRPVPGPLPLAPSI
jgi:hypothetical protein